MNINVEYVNYASGRFRSNTEPAPAVQTAYYKELKDVIKQEYKGTVNVKAGTELKFNTIMLRQGFAFYGNPYKDSNLKASAFLYTGGIGYRNKGFFVDLAYELNTSKEKVLPYRLADRPNTFASVNSQLINIGFTVGVKL